MRYAYSKFALFLAACMPAAAQINPNQIMWPQPQCSNPVAHWTPGSNTCLPVTTTGGMPLNNPQYTGTMLGPNAAINTIIASVNGTLFVMAPPYNAKCDGSTDDQAAINQALADGLTQQKIVELPAGICLTSTLAWHGTPMRGRGKWSTILRGKPGQDTIQGVNGNQYGTFISDMTIQVDGSVNAAATAAGGNNTFPTRVVGVQGDGSLTLWPTATTIAPGPVVVTGSMNAGSTTLTVPNGYFQSLAPEFVIGAPITVTGAGARGGQRAPEKGKGKGKGKEKHEPPPPSGRSSNLVTTITAVIDNNTVTLAAAAVNAITNATVTWGNPAKVSPPWYVGNCGIAMPLGDAMQATFNTNGAYFRDLQIQQYGTSNANHTCGFFQQSPPNDAHFERVDFMNFFIGYAEALPFTNANTLFAWTPDTYSYKDVNFKFNQIAAVFLNGSHRSLDGFNIYSGLHPMALGLFWLAQSGGNPSGTITRYYDECWSNNTGEHARFTSTPSGGINISGGSLIQCGGPYVEWDANYSTVDAQISVLHVSGNNNVFKNTAILPVNVVDKGANNSVDGSGNPTNGASPNASSKVWANRPHEPLNKLDAGFLLTGNPTTPFTSGNDLLITCDQFNFAYQQYGVGPGCTSDPTGTEITKSYLHMPVSVYPGWGMSPTAGGQGAGPYGKYLYLGDRLPLAKMTYVVIARCDAPCTQQANIGTSTTSVLGTTFSFGTTWTVQTASVDFSTSTLGDAVTVAGGTTNGTGVTYMDLALVAFVPQINANTLSNASASLGYNAALSMGNTGSTGPYGSITLQGYVGTNTYPWMKLCEAYGTNFCVQQDFDGGGSRSASTGATGVGFNFQGGLNGNRDNYWWRNAGGNVYGAFVNNLGGTTGMGTFATDHDLLWGGGIGWWNGTYIAKFVLPGVTANRSYTVPDGAGSLPIPASLTTTAAASDVLTIQGVTASSHCGLTATNASAGTNITTTFVSAKASNQITVTHAATAGMTYDLLCTAN